MAEFTKERRQEIIREFAVRHNGQYNPKLFLEEVRRVGESHDAHAWFEWNKDRAAVEHQLWQAREFAQGLWVTFSVEEVGGKEPVRVRQVEAPLVISPVESRRNGGGYVLFDANDPDHMAEHCRQAVQSLATWMRRYSSAVAFAGGSVETFEEQEKLLAQVSSVKDVAA